MASAAPVDLETHLAPFGLSRFRPGQKEVIATVLSGQDCLCVMPTGGGKSLCYQLPAIARDGVTLVVSPLIALMKDQVDQLQSLGLRATFINSTLSPEEQFDRLDRMVAGEYDLMYVVPERFRSPRFLEAVRRSNLQLLAIDEAHCVSEWGHDFRPDYAKLGRFRAELGNPPTIALTATATDVVRRDIIELLALRQPKSFVTGFARANLHYSVAVANSQRDKDEALVRFLGAHPGSGIVYASTRKRCEEVAQTIATRTGWPTSIYHAGMAADDRRGAQESFMQGRTQIVVATMAFGMGIDKSDVRFVVHYNLPGSLEAYYQEVGRAGRDGKPSHTLLLFSTSDRYVHEFFIESAYPSRQVVRQVYEFLCELDDNPIELTQQEVKERLGLQIGAEGVGTCEKLLEKSGVIERLDAVENMAAVRLSSDLPTLVDLLPAQAKVKRRVLRAVETVVRDQRHQWVYLQPRDLVIHTEMDLPAISRTLRELSSLKTFDYVPPFRGRAIHVCDRERDFDSLEIDFEASERRKAAEYERLGIMIRYAQSRVCRQQEILRYFGEAGHTACGHCDNCDKGGTKATHQPQQATAGQAGVIEAVRIVLSGVARTRGRYGKTLVAQMLCGSTSEKVTRNRLDHLSTYGLLSSLKQTEVAELIDALIAAGSLEQTEVDRFRPLLQITPRGMDVMTARADMPEGLPLSAGLFEKLRRLRPIRPSESQPIVNPAVQPAERPTVAPQDVERAVPIEARSPVVLANRVDTFDETADDVAEQIEAAGDDSALDTGHGELTLQEANARFDEANSAAADDDQRPVSNPSDVPMGRPGQEGDLQNPVPASDAAASVACGVQPSHYWTWRLLTSGFTAHECATIRGVTPDVVFDHALRAADSGWAVAAEWFLTPAQIVRLEKLIGPEPPARIRPLLAKLPKGTRYEEILLYLKCRGQAAGGSIPNASRISR